MKLIFAQGNPGLDYSKTRHNVGWHILDAYANKYNISFDVKTKLHAEIATISIDGEKILLVKPMTFYNETGRSARALIDFYKLDPAVDLLVVHDELSLPFGTLRIRDRGRDAGNNGIKSLNSHIGDSYTRLRVGVWNELRDRIDDADFVLAKFTKDEHEILEQTIMPQAVTLLDDFIHDTLTTSSHIVHKAD